MNKKIIISGTGFKPKTTAPNDSNIFNSDEYFINIGSATAQVLAKSGYDLVLISRTEEKLKKIKTSLNELYPDCSISYCVVDLTDQASVNSFIENLDIKHEYHYIHSAGLSATGYKIKDGNPYLEVEDIPIELPVKEFEVVIKSLLLMVQGLLPVFKKQKSSRVIVVNSMSGIRAYPLGFSHSAAKGGLHNAIRSLSLELSKKKVFFSEINPGIVNTGCYENPSVISSVKKIGAEFGYDFDEIPKLSPIAVAEAIELCLKSQANIMTINLLPEGQFKNQSS